MAHGRGKGFPASNLPARRQAGTNSMIGAEDVGLLRRFLTIYRNCDDAWLIGYRWPFHPRWKLRRLRNGKLI